MWQPHHKESLMMGLGTSAAVEENVSVTAVLQRTRIEAVDKTVTTALQHYKGVDLLLGKL